MRYLWPLLTLLLACSPTAGSPQQKPGAIEVAPDMPWYIGVFRGDGRERLALLPDGTLIFTPFYLGTYTFSDGLISFTSSSQDMKKEAKIEQEKDGVSFSIGGSTYHLKRVVGFSRYQSSGTPDETTLSTITGTWKKVAQAGAPLSDWQKASDALGPSLTSEETLLFSPLYQFTQTIGGVSRKGTFSLDGSTLKRTPDGVGYDPKPEQVRLYSDRLEIGPKESPDIYVKTQ